ncbi:MAG TPA: PQQ-binding-like beta-propeller repeat protein [Acidimicrobiia bacterium]|jgi:outer membrane protein assembly factor BamB
MRRRVPLLLLCIVTALGLTACDWAQLGFDASNASNNAFEPAFTSSSVTQLSTVWSQPCRCGRVLVANGRVYGVDESTPGTAAVRAFDAERGAPEWSRAFTSSPPLTTVQLDAIAGGLVYLVVGRTVVALDAATGSTAWSVDPPAPGTGTISLDHLVVDESGFPSGGAASTTAFVDVTAAISNANPVSEISAIDRTGRITWSVTPGGQSAGFGGVNTDDQPDSTQRTLDVVSMITTVQPPVLLLTQYDEGGGRLLHQVVIGPGGPTTSFPPPDRVAAANGLVYFVQVMPRNAVDLFATDPATGRVVWTGLGGGLYAIAHGTVVSGVTGPVTGLVALDAHTGQVVWQVPGAAGPAVAASVLFDTLNGVIEARDLTTGTRLGSFSVATEALGPATPSEGLLYASSAQQLYAVAPTGH